MHDPRARPVSILVVAAGRGARMGADRNKVLLDLDGRPVLTHTIESLAIADVPSEIVVVTRPEERPEIEAATRRAGGSLPSLVFVPGGAERADSVRNGLEAISADTAVVMVHDAARPFVRPRLLVALAEHAAEHGAAIPALPVVDTLKRDADGLVLETVDRAGLSRAQTPQAFQVKLLRAALAAPTSAGATDDAAAVERIGHAVALVTGDPWNIKITTPEDLALARALLPSFLARRQEEMTS